MTLDVHIVSHTHWDREWYHPLERFRQRLVALIDELLDDPPAGGESFLLDGQAIVIDDYLDVRPERAAEIGELLRDGRLEAGPWYVLADELIPERRSARQKPVGRAPSACVASTRRRRPCSTARIRSDTRPRCRRSPPGLGCRSSCSGAATAVRAGRRATRFGGGRSGGDEALVFHLPRDGYEFGSHLPVDEVAARARWIRMRDELAPRSALGVTLIPHGADHHARPAGLSTTRSTPSSASRRRTACAAARSARSPSSLFEARTVDSLPVVRGELRDSYGYTWTLQGTFATRAHEKRMNATAERLLTREAEPWSALGVTPRPVRRSARRRTRGERLLGAHPHDTLCGCSIDDVASAMELRIRSAANQAAGIRDDSIARLIGHDAAAARDVARSMDAGGDGAKSGGARAVRGRGARRRAVRRRRTRWTRVQRRRKATAQSPCPARSRRVSGLGALQVLVAPSRVLANRVAAPLSGQRSRVGAQVAAWISDAPAYGITSYPIGDESSGKRRAGSSRPPDRVTVAQSTLRNATLDVTISAARRRIARAPRRHGRRIDVAARARRRSATSAISYTPAPRDRPFRVSVSRRATRASRAAPRRARRRTTESSTKRSRERLRRCQRSPHARCAAHAFLRMSIVRRQPRRKPSRSPGGARRHRRRERLGGCRVRPGAPRANRRRRSGGGDGASARRPRRCIATSRSFNESAGITVFSDGLAEYEARDDGAMLVTLVRGVGELSRNDLA